MWKGRMVCKRNYNKGSGRKAGDMDALYATPVDLHSKHLVMMYGALHRAVCQADVKPAYLRALVGGCELGSLPPTPCDINSKDLELCRAWLKTILPIALGQCRMALKIRKQKIHVDFFLFLATPFFPPGVPWFSTYVWYLMLAICF